ncbi:MAG: CTP synthase C-terminal region-related (seleno)protein [Acidimicrobiales bacterium]
MSSAAGAGLNLVKLAVVGDYQPANDTHLATTSALAHAADEAGLDVEVSWLATDEVAPGGDEQLEAFDGFVIAPGSPYRSMKGALYAITWARTQDVPLLATCGGFQHVILEFARTVLGAVDADHAEYDPYASDLFITPLSCSMAGLAMEVRIGSGTVAAGAYGRATTTERYYCNFGLNPDRVTDLIGAGLVISGTDQDDEVRIVELPDLHFFVATLFVPQTSSAPGRPHPLCRAFLVAAGGQ